MSPFAADTPHLAQHSACGVDRTNPKGNAPSSYYDAMQQRDRPTALPYGVRGLAKKSLVPSSIQASDTLRAKVPRFAHSGIPLFAESARTSLWPAGLSSTCKLGHPRLRIQGYPPFASEVALYLSKRARHLMTLFVVNMPPSAQRIGFGVPKPSFPRAETAPSAQWFGFRVPKLTFPRSNTASSAQRIGFGVSRATSSACHAASAHAPHFGTHRNPHPGTHRNANPGGYRNANPGTHRDAGPRVPPAKQQVDESAEEPPGGADKNLDINGMFEIGVTHHGKLVL